MRKSMLLVTSLLYFGQVNSAFAGCGFNCIGSGISTVYHDAKDDIVDETHRAGHGIVYASKIAGKDVSREFKSAADNMVEVWGNTYRGLVPDEKLRYILNTTAALATMYYMPESAWLILIERKITISAEVERQKRAATSQAEIDSLSAAETAMHIAEDSTVLIDAPNEKVSLQSKLDQYKNEFTVCIKNAGDDRKAQMRCQITYGDEVLQAQKESL